MLAYKRSRSREAIQDRKVARAILLSLASGPFATHLHSGNFLIKGFVNYLIKKSDFNHEAKRLVKKEFIALTKTPEGWLVRLTKKGQRGLHKAKLQDLKLSTPESWDGKWRLFIFDVPEELRSARDQMRWKLKELGLFNIQRSVLAYPYDCRAELELISDYYKLRRYATYLETDNIDIDQELRRYFKFSKNKKYKI